MGPAGSGIATKLCVNALLGLGIQALAKPSRSVWSGLPHGALPAGAGKYRGSLTQPEVQAENVAQGRVSGHVSGLRLMFKDFTLIEQRAMELSVPMPLTVAAAQKWLA